MGSEPSSGVSGGLLGLVRRAYATLRGSATGVDGYDFRRHDPLVTYDLPPEYDEKDRYWVNAPFAFVVIYDDPGGDELRYRVVEPELSEFESELLDALTEDIRYRLVYARSDAETGTEAVLTDELRTMLGQYGVVVDASTFYKLLYYLDRAFTGYRGLAPLMNDPHIEDISCDGYDIPVFVYHDEFDDLKTNIAFGNAELDELVIRLGQMAGRQLSVGEPISNATLPDGSRAELVYTEEVSPHGSAFTVRRYAEDTMSPVDLIDYGTFSVEQMAYFWLAIENRMNLLFAGGTASGKTTSMNAVSMFLPPTSKVITIEDTREISLAHDNWLSNVTRERVSEDSNIDMYDLLRSALRHRPEYIIVGEVRGAEALTLFQAMNTGHTTYSTMHADSVQTVINRLENEPIDVPRAMVQSLDILSIQTLTRLDDRRVRRADRVAEIGTISDRTGDLNYSDQYSWDPQSDSFSGRFTDSGVLDRIVESQGWSSREFREEFRDRQRVLQHLVDENISRYDRFTAVVRKYARDPDAVLAWVDGDASEVPADVARPASD